MTPEEKLDLDAILEPEGWEPPEFLSPDDIVALAAERDRRAADILEERKAIAANLLPDGISPDDEISISWERSKKRMKVRVSLGGARIVVNTTHAGAEILPWLIQALPSALDAVGRAIEQEEA